METNASRFLEHFASTHLLARDGDAVAESRTCAHDFPVVRPRIAAKRCGSPPSFIGSAKRSASCADLRHSRLSALRGVRLVLGVTSAPDRWGALRRAGIRQTWMHYPGVGQSTLVCFVVGRRRVRRKDLVRLDAEAALHGDLVFLRGTVDGQGPFVTISKLHAWFRLASELLGLIDRGESGGGGGESGGGSGALSSAEAAQLHPSSPRHPIGGYAAAAAHSVRHIGKVDDDTFIHVPELQRELDALHCVRGLYIGNLAYSGYNPLTFTKCGFDYSPSGGRYRTYNCAASPPANAEHAAAYPPFPWTSGALVLASTTLIVRIAADGAIGRFVARSADPTGPHQPGMRAGHNTDEDVAMGFWLSRFHRAGVARVTYVRANERLTNLGCRRNDGLYRPPRDRSMGVHFVKTAGGMQYVWGVLADGQKPNVTRCHRMTGDYRL